MQCRCRLGDTGPCILCCGMKNRVAELHSDLCDREDVAKAAILDNCIHTKLSGINGNASHWLPPSRIAHHHSQTCATR